MSRFTRCCLGLFGGEEANRSLIVGVDAFFIIHAFLHIFLRNLPDNRFRSAFSWALIAGAGIFGAIDLLSIL